MSAQNPASAPQMGNANYSHPQCPDAPRKSRPGNRRLNKPLISSVSIAAALAALDISKIPTSLHSRSTAVAPVKQTSGVHKATAMKPKPKPQPNPVRTNVSTSASSVLTTSTRSAQHDLIFTMRPKDKVIKQDEGKKRFGAESECRKL